MIKYGHFEEPWVKKEGKKPDDLSSRIKQASIRATVVQIFRPVSSCWS